MRFRRNRVPPEPSVALPSELALFAVRPPGGGIQLITADGIILIAGATWRQVRTALDASLKQTPNPPRVIILVGRPAPSPDPIVPEQHFAS